MTRLSGILFIAISAASFGTLAIFGRYAYADGMDTFTILFLRFGISALIMTAVLLFRGEVFPRGLILAQLIAMGGLGYVGQSFSYLTATRYASPALAALLLYLYPFVVAILSVFFLTDTVTIGKVTPLTMPLI